MTSIEFLKQFVLIESYLYSIAPDFNKDLGFFDLLEYLKNSNLISEDALQNLRIVRQTRNKVASSAIEIAIESDIAEKLLHIKQGLNI